MGTEGAVDSAHGHWALGARDGCAAFGQGWRDLRVVVWCACQRHWRRVAHAKVCLQDGTAAAFGAAEGSRLGQPSA